jgi:hypothetical protein
MAQLHRSLLLIFQLIAILCALFRSINLKNVTFLWFIVIVSSFKCPSPGTLLFFPDLEKSENSTPNSLPGNFTVGR